MNKAVIAQEGSPKEQMYTISNYNGHNHCRCKCSNIDVILKPKKPKIILIRHLGKGEEIAKILKLEMI